MTRSVDGLARVIAHVGGPLVEPVTGRPDRRLVTFAWREPIAGPAHDVVLLVTGDEERSAGPAGGRWMRRVPGIGMHVLQMEVDAGLRTTYRMHVSEGRRNEIEAALACPAARTALLAEAIADPLNPFRFPGIGGLPASSIVAASGGPPRPAAVDSSNAGPVEHLVADRLTETERRVWVHQPPVGPRSDEATRLLVLLDGRTWAHDAPIGCVLDALVVSGAIPPTVAVLVDTAGAADHTGDGDGGPSVGLADFIGSDLLAWATSRLPVDLDPAHVIVAGQGSGGVTAIHGALRRPDRIGNVLTQSGSFEVRDPHRGGDERYAMRADVADREIRVCIQVGDGEGARTTAAHHLAGAMRGMGHDVQVGTTTGIADHFTWHEGMVDGLVHLANPA